MLKTMREAISTLLRCTIPVLICAAFGVTLAHAAGKSLHVGILSSGILENRGGLDAALVQGLRDHGYIEGQNLFIERRYDTDRIPESARELAGMKLDAIITTCTTTTRAAKRASASTPIVMAAVSDPVGQRIIDSLAKPGQNVTGTSSQAEDLLSKRLELFATLLPKPTTIAVLAVSWNPVHALGWKRLKTAADEMHVRLLKIEISEPDEIPAAIEGAARARASALFVMPDDPVLFNARPVITEVAARQRMPDFYWAREFVESGGLISYGENLRDSYRNVASYVDKIAKGAKPATLPVGQPTRFELIINMRTAQALGLKIPQPVLLRADELVN